MRRWEANNWDRSPRVVDLFSGAGGLALGLRLAGLAGHSVLVEQDKDCIDTLKTNLPDSEMVAADIRDVDPGDFNADIIVAAPPCQGFSTLNRNRKGDARNVLSLEVLRWIRQIRPSLAVIENVPAFLKSQEARHLQGSLADLGYIVRNGVLNSADFGVPQSRLRALVVAAAPGLPCPWPAQTHANGGTKGLPRWRTVADGLAMLPDRPDGINWHREYARRPQYDGRYRFIPAGGGRKHLPRDLVLPCWAQTEGYSDVLGRLRWDLPSVTIRTAFFRAEKGRYLHPTQHRPISVREAARLQSFPDSFVFGEYLTLTAVGKQIGNATPPRLGQAIGLAVMRALKHRPPQHMAFAG